MDRLWQDFRFAARSLARTPGLAIVAILTLALGIGANSAVFSLVNTVLIRPLPFADPSRLVIVNERVRSFDHGNVSGHEFAAWRDQNRTFDGLAMFSYAGFTLTGSGDPVSVSARTVTANYFDVLGARPLVGTSFKPGDDSPSAERLAVIGYHLWSDRFGRDSNVVGRRVMLDDVPFLVIGVMPPRGDMDADLWVAMNLAAERQKVGKHGNVVIGRLRRDVSIATASADLGVVARDLERQYPEANAGHGVNVVSLYDEVVGDTRRPFAVAMGAVFFILLIACANVGHLLLTRGAARQKEFAIRAALGAGRSRLVRQLVTEALLLSTVGGILGLVVAAWVTDLLPTLSALNVPRLGELSIDWHVLAATAALCVVTGLTCGLIPAFRASTPRLHLWLSDGARSAQGPGRTIASVLVVSEVAVAAMLLVGAGLSVKSFVRLMRVNPGFDARDVVTVGLPLPGPRYPGVEQQRRAVGEFVDDVAHVTGVQIAGATTMLPLGPCCNNMGITLEGKPVPRPGQEIEARLTIVAGRYFDALRIPLRRGRMFEPSDARVAIPLIRWYEQQPAPAHFGESQPAPVAVVNETMARQLWPGEEVLGKRFRILFSPWITIVGVVGDVRQSGLLEPGTPQMYLSNLQEPSSSMTLVARTIGDPSRVAPLIRARLHAFDKALPIGAMATMDRVVWDSVGRPRFNALLFGASGAIALLLAVIGVYGVISYAVQRRTREIGIRRALGAQTGDVLGLVLGQAFRLVLIGIACGTVGAIALTRVMATLLYDVKPTDPATFVGVAAMLAGVALLASYLPGRRATRVDPTDALRSE